MADELRSIVVAAAAGILLAACVQYPAPRQSVDRRAPIEFGDPAADAALKAAGRTLALGKEPALERWVVDRPDGALAILESRLTGSLVDSVAGVYQRRCGGPVDREACRVLRPDARASDARLQELLEACGTGPGCHWGLALALELSARHAKAGDLASASREWIRAVSLGLQSNDPGRLERALASVPADAGPLEAEVAARFLDLSTERGEASRAVSVATRVRSSSPTLDLARARALRACGRSDEAWMLVQDSGSGPAQALAGVLLADRGDLAGARALLEKSLAARTDWPGAGRASADLGVVLLLLGQEQEGLEAMSRARSLAEKEGDATGLVRTLLNEAAYLADAQRLTESSTCRTRAEIVARDEGILIED